MPRYEYIDHEGNAHVISAPDEDAASVAAWNAEFARTANMRMADMAGGTVEQSDERSRAA